MVRWQRAFYQPAIGLGEDGVRVTASKEHRLLAKTVAKEGMVLLKNENQVLPFKKGSKLALFGKGTFDYVKGGGGSGDVTVSYVTNLYDGFMELKNQVSVFEETADFYKKNVEQQYEAGAIPGLTVEPELSDELCKNARNYTDTAVVTFCRFSGEGWDRRSTYDKDDVADDMVKKSKEIFEKGDFYLSKAEEALLEKVTTYFPKVVIVLNVGGMVDTSWFYQNSKVQSVLMAWQGGMEGGRAMAELLCGLGNPSGKLSDTFAKRLEDYPSSYNFHESDDYVDYTDDIYVGYRYFETIPDAYEKVNYPFGYGLSYTSFEWKIVSATIEPNEIANAENTCEEKVKIQIQILNTGKMAGKEVLQAYVEAPQGLLGKAKKSLVAFEKTRCLQAGEQQIVTLEFPVNAMASYDDLGKVTKSAYVLEAGEYRFFVGTSVRDGEWLDMTYTLSENKVVAQLQPKLVPNSLKERMLADGSMERLPLTEAHDTDENVLEFLDKVAMDGLTPETRKLAGVCLWRWKYKDNIRPFCEVAEGKMSIEEFLGQMTDEELAHLLGGQPNTSVANTFGIGNMPEYGIPNIMTADGPAGLRIAPECGVCTTAWPCATLLACTWNEGLVEEEGAAAALEVKENNIYMWLTPGVNIHRSPLCGRNFEYYSEDPFLCGKMAGAMVRGIQSRNIAATVKHFAFNNKETNRKNSDSRVSERAAREIYLKAFEIIVKEAKPWAIMSSYNIVNGIRTSENKELLEDILRDEWGFDGMVTSDWWTFGEHYKEVKAGNDVKMAIGYPERLVQAKEQGALSREEMERCAKRILQLILKME